jgi:hypothetical protein
MTTPRTLEDRLRALHDEHSICDLVHVEDCQEGVAATWAHGPVAPYQCGVMAALRAAAAIGAELAYEDAAKLCEAVRDDYGRGNDPGWNGANACAEDIRARAAAVKGGKL